jgi:hypothetical protein
MKKMVLHPNIESKVQKLKLKSLLLFLVIAMPTIAFAQTQSEAEDIRAFEARESHRPAYIPDAPSKFRASDHVYVKSALAIDFAYRKANVTLPLYRGLSASGESVYYVLTDASDFGFARALGINYAPKLDNAAGSPGAQNVRIKDGLITFTGNVDFSPVYTVVPGSPSPFPWKVAEPGALADAEWSSIVVLPSGIVINAYIVANKSGTHDRLKSIDIRHRTVTLSLLNLLPLGPDNDNSSESNNYSPLWDAHISPKAINEGKVHRILSMDEQKQLIADGYLTSATGDADSPINSFVGRLHPAGLIINCPVIAHPELPAR